MSAVKDLTKGSPMKLILGFMLPMLLGLLFQHREHKSEYELHR